MQSRAVIEQAKGKLMAIEGFSPDEAFTRLARVSQSENVKLRELARQVVDEDRRL
jgi:AmiR/NasT family two-component response regulator